MKWISTKSKLPPPDKQVFICVRNKNKKDGIWLYDIASHDGEVWHRENTWEDIIYWAYPEPPEED